MWEQEEAKKWTKVLSKSQKCSAKAKSQKSQSVGVKKVWFAPQIVLNSLVKKSAPVLPSVQFISFGKFNTTVDPLDSEFESFTVQSPKVGSS